MAREQEDTCLCCKEPPSGKVNLVRDNPFKVDIAGRNEFLFDLINQTFEVKAAFLDRPNGRRRVRLSVAASKDRNSDRSGDKK